VGGSIALATAFGLFAALGGLLLSYHANLPSGPAIILTSALPFGVSMLLATVRLRIRGMRRLA
jgi:zinc/manganese transport system permease protein